MSVSLSRLVSSKSQGMIVGGSALYGVACSATENSQNATNKLFLLISKLMRTSKFKKIFDGIIIPLLKPNNFINAIFCTLSGVIIVCIMQMVILSKIRDIFYLSALLVITLLLSIFYIDYEKMYRASLFYRFIRGIKNIIIS